jgi:hypothetical protein
LQVYSIIEWISFQNSLCKSIVYLHMLSTHIDLSYQDSRKALVNTEHKSNEIYAMCVYIRVTSDYILIEENVYGGLIT